VSSVRLSGQRQANDRRQNCVRFSPIRHNRGFPPANRDSTKLTSVSLEHRGEVNSAKLAGASTIPSYIRQYARAIDTTKPRSSTFIVGRWDPPKWARRRRAAPIKGCSTDTSPPRASLGCSPFFSPFPLLALYRFFSASRVATRQFDHGRSWSFPDQFRLPRASLETECGLDDGALGRDVTVAPMGAAASGIRSRGCPRCRSRIEKRQHGAPAGTLHVADHVRVDSKPACLQPRKRWTLAGDQQLVFGLGPIGMSFIEGVRQAAANPAKPAM